MSSRILVLLSAALPVLAGTSQREAVSVLSDFDILPVAPYPSSSAGTSWASEGNVSAYVGSGSSYALAVTAPHLKVGYVGGDLDLRDPQTGDHQVSLRRSRFDLGTGIALSQLGLGSENIDLALGGDLVRDKGRATDFEGGSVGQSWANASVRFKFGANQIFVETERLFVLDADSGAYRDPLVKFGFGSVREGGLQWGIGASIPLHDDREIGLSLGAEKTFSQALSFRVQGCTLYKKAVSSSTEDSGQSKWIRSGLGLSMGTSLRFRPWLPDRDPSWIQSFIDPLGGSDNARFLYDWEIGALVRIDALSGTSTAGVTLGRWF